MDSKELPALLGKMEEILESEQNVYNRSFYKEQPPFGRGARRGVPKLREDGLVPFVVEADTSFWARVIELDVASFWNEPSHYIAGQLKMDLHKSQVLKDNTYFTGEICPWPGVVFELSLFGLPVKWHKDRGPWIENREPILKEYGDLDKLKKPDFLKSGLMPTVHEFYRRFQDLVQDRMTVVFPEWVYGPFGIAAQLRGLTELLMDTIRNPEWVARLLRFIADSHKEYSTERSKYVGVPIQKTKIYDDEVDCPIISPKVLEQFILPLETDLVNFHGGIVYYHSCGKLTKLLPLIKKLPDLEMLHLGPWTDIKEALRIFAPKTAFDVCLDPVKDIFEADETQMKERLDTIMSLLQGNSAFSIRADGFMAQGDDTATYYAKLRNWCEIARRSTGQA